MFKYITNEIITEIRQDFFNFLESNNPYSGDFKNKHKSNIRKNMLMFFNSFKFQNNYKKLALSLGEECGVKSEQLLYQPLPTPRIFRPGDHGTGWHCDYWYGHGETFYTAWIPIIGVTRGSTFQMLHQTKSDYFFDRFERNPDLFKEKISINKSDYFDVMPDKNSLALFNSKHIHGSLLNSSDVERISFDFRFGNINDKTSTKNLSSYQSLISKSKVSCSKTLKYICGGRGIDTSSQHILIENYNEFGYFNIIAQEAEIERYNQPILRRYASEIENKTSQFDSIAIASVNLIDKEIFKYLSKIKSKIFCCLEGKFLNDLI